MTELTEAELDDLQHRFDGWPQVQRLIAAARKGIAAGREIAELKWKLDNYRMSRAAPAQREEDRPGYIHASKRGERQCEPVALPEGVHDNEATYVPGTYMMSTREAIEAGLISYDAPVVPEVSRSGGLNCESIGAGESSLCNDSKPHDLEKLMERLDYCINEDDWCIEQRTLEVIEDAAVVLRSLVGENRKLWGSNREYADECERLAERNAALAAETVKWLDEALDYKLEVGRLDRELGPLRAEKAKVERGLNSCMAGYEKATHEIRAVRAKLERAKDALILCDCVLNGDDHSWNAAKEAVRATLEEIND